MSSTKTTQISRLSALARLNGVELNNIRVAETATDQEGFGIVADADLASENEQDNTVLLRIPEELILSHQSVLEYARIDQHFKTLLELLADEGRHLESPKIKMMFFLLYQLIICNVRDRPTGVSGFWTEYMSVLPQVVYLPTQYTLDQLEMLKGTSLEDATFAKNFVLHRQYEKIVSVVNAMNDKPNGLWFNSSDVQLKDWIHVDSLFRSRSLDIPGIGESMAPFIDMANHSREPSAIYERPEGSSEVLLQLRPGAKVAAGDEITISYGADKSPAELLFSYGFNDDVYRARNMVLEIDRDLDDPFAKAKLAAWGQRPSTRLYLAESGEPLFESPFLYFMLVNEEDGLGFKFTQTVDDAPKELRTFFNGVDVTDKIHNFKELLSDHPQKDVYELRVSMWLLSQTMRRWGEIDEANERAETLSKMSDNLHIGPSVMRLRDLEDRLISKFIRKFYDEKTRLSESPAVLEYFRNIDEEEEEDAVHHSQEEDDDFS